MQYHAGKFNVFKDFSDMGLSAGLMWGRSYWDIFAGRKGTLKELMHYNGDDWVPLIPLPPTSIWSIVMRILFHK